MFADGIREAFRLLIDQDPVVMNAAGRTLFVSGSAVFLAAMVGIPLGTFVATKRFVGRRLLILLGRTGMAFPTAFIGILGYSFFARGGVLGGLELIYTPWAIILGEFLLALPITFSLTQGAVSALDPRASETARTLGAGKLRHALTLLSEARTGILLGVLTALARCMTELGVAVMVGGNIAGRTRTLAGSIVLESSRGEYSRGLAMGFLLLLLSLGVTSILVLLSFERDREAKS
ncbi:MAG: ABC transporter permease [Planctomycetota bacterium]